MFGRGRPCPLNTCLETWHADVDPGAELEEIKISTSHGETTVIRHLRQELFFSPTLKCDGRNSADTQVHLLNPSPLSLTQLPPVSPITVSPVDYGPQSEFAEPTIKRRKRADARQLEALHSTRVRTPSPFTEERSHIAKDLDMSPRSAYIRLAPAFFYTTLMISDVDHFLGCQDRQGECAATNPSHNPVTAPIPMLTPPVGGDSSSQIHLTPSVGPSGRPYVSCTFRSVLPDDEI
jgi:hypothetical protein